MTSVVDAVHALRWVRATVGQLQPVWQTVLGVRSIKRTVKEACSKGCFINPTLLSCHSAPLTEALSIMDRVAGTVCMKLGSKKCNVAHVQKGRVLHGPENLSTTSHDGIKCLPDRYAYLYIGVEQLFVMDSKKVKDSVIAEYWK